MKRILPLLGLALGILCLAPISVPPPPASSPVGNATQSTAGLMSPADKAKMDGYTQSDYPNNTQMASAIAAAQNTGPQGSPGASGSNGSNGTNGSAGAKGDKGDTGSSGTTGSTGAAGTNGADGSAGPAGSSGIISVTAPIINSGTSTSATIGISAATTGAAGSMSSTDKTKLDAFPSYAARSFTNNASHSIIVTAAAANGFQLSSTRDADARYSVSISTTATIGGAATGYVVFEICATNSATAGNWQEVARLTNGQTITLAVALQSSQVIGGQLAAIIPSGYYARLRSVSSSGSPTFAFVSGQEVLL